MLRPASKIAEKNIINQTTMTLNKQTVKLSHAFVYWNWSTSSHSYRSKCLDARRHTNDWCLNATLSTRICWGKEPSAQLVCRSLLCWINSCLNFILLARWTHIHLHWKIPKHKQIWNQSDGSWIDSFDLNNSQNHFSQRSNVFLVNDYTKVNPRGNMP